MLAQNLVYKQNNHQLTIFPPRLDCTVEWKFGQIPQVLIFFSNLQEKALSWHNCPWKKTKTHSHQSQNWGRTSLKKDLSLWVSEHDSSILKLTPLSMNDEYYLCSPSTPPSILHGTSLPIGITAVSFSNFSSIEWRHRMSIHSPRQSRRMKPTWSPW